VTVAAAPIVIERLRKSRISSGLVIELGCGSGILAERLNAAGYDVLGFGQRFLRTSSFRPCAG
jgi:2-polyprenyl-3-methyl-5-hydroxy-6-metoxy-1,4-benzoquinol methylase